MKKVIIGFIAGVIFATAGTAAASTVIEKVTASIRTDYSVEVDGKKIELQNAPLAYNGSSYIAVREIANVIGKEVGFKDGVIQINTPVSEVVTKEQYETKLFALTGIRKGYVDAIELNNEAIRRADNGEFKPSESQYQEYVDAVSEYEKLLSDVDKQIADLKAAYPQYAESAK